LCTGYSWALDPDDSCWSYDAETNSWTSCAANVTSSYSNTYCYDLNGLYMSGKYYTSTYCGEPQPATNFLQQGTYYWLNLSAPCAMTTQCSQAASTSGVTFTSTSSEYDYQSFRYALDHDSAFLVDYSRPLAVYWPVLIANTTSNTPLPAGSVCRIDARVGAAEQWFSRRMG
jgi:hypothetical protein